MSHAIAHRLAVRALLGLVLGGSACGSELSGDEAAVVPDAVDDRTARALALLDGPWCEPFAERFCAAAATCGCDETPGWPADCRARALATCRLDLVTRAAAVGPDFLASPEAAPRCLEVLDAALADCATPEASLFQVECPLVTAPGGTSFPRSGEPCSLTRACGRGLRCATDGFCRLPHPLGASCFSDLDCEPALTCAQTCDRTGCTAACAERAPAPDLGTPCDRFMGGCSMSPCVESARFTCQVLDDSGRCQSDQDCPVDQFCGGFDVVARCVPLPTTGAPCAFGIRCADGLACQPFTGTCGPIPRRGEPCAPGLQGQILCADGLVCRDGTCGDPGQLSETCNFGLPSCAAPLTCDFDAVGTPRCGPARQVDEPCQTDETCAPELACDFSVATCQLRHALGERCDDGLRCALGTDCVRTELGELRCALVDSAGDACASTCPRGLSCLPVFSSGLCLPPVCAALPF